MLTFFFCLIQSNICGFQKITQYVVVLTIESCEVGTSDLRDGHCTDSDKDCAHPTHRHPHARVWVRLRTSSCSGIGQFEDFCSSVDKPEEKESGKKVLFQEYPTRPRAQREGEKEGGGVVFVCVGFGFGVFFAAM